jgi:hypothetical protein
MSWADGGAPIFYANGDQFAVGPTIINKGTSAPASISLASVITSYIRQIPSTIGAVLATNRALTADEHYQVYEELRAMTWPNKTWSRNIGQVCIDPDATGLVAAYDMHPCDGVVKDLSGNGNDGTINGPVFENTEIGGSMATADGEAHYIDCGDGFRSLTDVTVSFLIKVKSVPDIRWAINYYESTIDEWGLYISSVSSDLVSFSIFDDIDNANALLYTTQVPTNVYHNVVIQMDSLENKLWINSELVGSGVFASDYWSSLAGNLYINNRSSALSANSTPCNISNVQIFNRALSQSEITQLYNCGAQAVNFKTDYGVCESVAAETSGELSNSPFRIESGSFKISTDTIGGDTCKVIECVTAGVCQVPAAYFFGDETQAAHGSFEWWMLKDAASVSRVAFIGSQNTEPAATGFDGYSFRVTIDEAVRLYKYTNGSSALLFTTSDGFFSTTLWSKIKITRSSDGEFTGYINDTLIDVSGGSGTNPITDTTYTTSKYIVLDLDAGDKIAYAAPNGDCSIVKYQGVV